jgi:uncharacterized protein (TIGR03083 family)
MAADEARDGIAALRRLHDELVEYTHGFDEEALHARSGSSEWTVADVLSHLGSGAEIGLATLTTGRSDMDAAPAVWARWNTMSSTEKASNFVTADERLVEALEALDGEALANKKVDFVFLPQPVDVAFVARMRLTEAGLHRWDLEVAFDPNATVANYVVPFVLHQLPMFAGFFAKPIGKTGTVEVQISEPSRSYVLELTGDGASLTEGQAAAATSHLSGPAEAFVRLTSGRLKAGHTPAAVKTSGPVSLDDLRRVFPGY